MMMISARNELLDVDQERDQFLELSEKSDENLRCGFQLRKLAFCEFF